VGYEFRKRFYQTLIEENRCSQKEMQDLRVLKLIS
jgi:hypothetical protein